MAYEQKGLHEKAIAVLEKEANAPGSRTIYGPRSDSSTDGQGALPRR